jgi:hypothetical protein
VLALSNDFQVFSFFLLVLVPVAFVWCVQAGVGLHRALYRENRRLYPALWSRDGVVRRWLCL